MYHRFVAISPVCYGIGSSPEEALENMYPVLRNNTNQRRKLPITVTEYISALPFAPPHRDATKDEADVWCNDDQSTSYLRCSFLKRNEGYYRFKKGKLVEEA